MNAHRSKSSWRRKDVRTTYTDIPAGAVYLTRKGDQVVSTIEMPALAAPLTTERIERLFLPCHNSTFGLDGSVTNDDSPSPRGMDTMETKVEDGQVWIQFQQFRPNIAEKISHETLRKLVGRSRHSGIMMEALYEKVLVCLWRYVQAPTRFLHKSYRALCFGCFTAQVLRRPGKASILEHQVVRGFPGRSSLYGSGDDRPGSSLDGVIDGAYKAPRELNFWFGILMMGQLPSP